MALTIVARSKLATARVVLAMISSVCVSLGVEPELPRRPNIMVILADDLGYGDIGCFGQKMLKTPALDTMAAQGMRFTQFYAGSAVGAPSRCVLLTGRHAGHAVVRGNSSKTIMIPPGTPTVASFLKGAAYTTACVGKWAVGTLDNLTNPNDVGFDHFFGYINAAHAQNAYPEFLVRNGRVERLRNEAAPEWKRFQNPTLPDGGRGVAAKRVEYAPGLLVDDALRFIREQRTSPFFLYLALNTPHANGDAGNDGMEVDDLGDFAAMDWPAPEKAFAAMIRNLDRDIGRMLGALREAGIEKNTLVIFTSENGPPEEGGHKAEFFDSNGKYRGIEGDLAEGGIRVPMIAWWPGIIPAASENDRQWYVGDVFATVAELIGTRPPDGLDSDSFVTALRGQPSEDKWKRKSRLYWECYEGQTAQAVRFGKWKAIRSPMFTGPLELYDLSNDHGETRTYAQRRPDLARHAANLLNEEHQPDPNWSAPAPR